MSETLTTLPGAEFDHPHADAPGPMTSSEADFVIDRLASIDERAARIKRQAEALVKECDRQRDAILFQHGDRLREWTASQLRGKARSVKRLYGTCGFRTNPGRVTIADATQAREWCEQWLPEALVVSVNAKAVQPVKAPDPETGEVVTTVPPGFGWVTERESFYVRGCRPDAGQEGEETE